MKKHLTSAQTQNLLLTLKTRFEKYPSRHIGLQWPQIQQKLESSPEKCWSLSEMESSGGEPDVIGQSPSTRHPAPVTHYKNRQILTPDSPIKAYLHPVNLSLAYSNGNYPA